ncbi:GNAT family N-acetyltransferase [Paraglaciecola sp. 20A4]|uniref:GNAT family N-acetyltransferase n=1 Tax=Paraglaciecola sp. 20A4 TaxID=2687288 RepID=UPI00140E056D|nr:GNAT family N-acetyltransferase [Paraglaciecola sp. 20A4]
MTHILETDRLILRNWIQSDYTPFYALNADPVAMRYFPSIYTQAQSDSLADKCKAHITQNGWGLWAVCTKSDNFFIGFVGLHTPDTNLPCSPCIEIGWRLQPEYWGLGYASEAAHKALEYGFNELALPEIVSFTAKINQPSRVVMKRIGMRDTTRNFQHPSLSSDNPLAEHVLYNITRDRWLQQVNPSRIGYSFIK